jgi:hypothetical protein
VSSCVGDYIAPNHEFAGEDDNHQLELLFRCKLLASEIPTNGPHPDTWQLGVEWLALSDLDCAQLYPKMLVNLLSDLDQQHAIYEQFREPVPRVQFASVSVQLARRQSAFGRGDHVDGALQERQIALHRGE